LSTNLKIFFISWTKKRELEQRKFKNRPKINQFKAKKLDKILFFLLNPWGAKAIINVLENYRTSAF